jgi:hypothetical protein
MPHSSSFRESLLRSSRRGLFEFSLPGVATLSSLVMVALFATWQILVSRAYAAPDTYGDIAKHQVEIAKHQEKFANLENELLMSQRLMLSSAGADGIQVATYAQLEYTAQLLASADREFSVLSQSLSLAALVTEARSVPLARRFVQLQKEYMLKRISTSADFIEQNKHRAKDPETSRLLLEARDLLRSSVSLIQRIP